MSSTRDKIDAMAASAVQVQQSLFTEQQITALNSASERARRRARLVESGVRRVISPRLAGWIEHDSLPRETDAMRLVREFYHRHNDGNEPANILVLMGMMGIGKTGAVAWLLARPERLLRGRPLKSDVRVYCSADRLRLAYQARGPEFERICSARIAVIDELGTEGDEREEARSAPRASPSVQNAIREFVTLRTGDETLLSVFVSNVSERRIRQRLDPRTINKIDERACWWVAGGPNLRVPMEKAP